MKVLITGAFGFVSRRLIDELSAAGHELWLLDRCRPADATVFVPGEHERQASPMRTHWPCIQADITDHQAMLQAVEGMNAVIHLAAGVTGLPEFGVDTFRINALGTYVVLDACRLAGVKRFLCASSINAFGTMYWRISGKPPVYHTLPLDESFPPVPEDAYSLSKLVNEETCAAFHRAYGITTAAFRFSAIWSEQMFDKAVTKGLPPTAAWSDDLYIWVHLVDVVRGIRHALEAADLPGYGTYMLNAADTRCPEPTMEILERFRPDLVRSLTAPLPGRTAMVSSARAAQAFGYAPSHRLGA
jgi:UDP-glucose 4-epimerase